MKRNPWSWVPSLYFAEGLPYVLVMTVSVIMYKNLGLSNGDIALYTSWLYLPWVIKPFWSPFVDILGTKRIWITAMQILIGAGLAGIAFSIPTSFFIQASLSFFWLLAFASATHDIAADGFYMLGLPEEHQSLFVGIRSTFYRISMIAGQGGLVVLAGWLAQSFDNDFVFAWSMVFYVASGLFLAIAAWHLFILPHPTTDCSRTNSVGRDFVRVFTTFIQKKELLVSILFILFFRFGEAQLAKIASPFLLDARSVGGLGLSTTQVGFIYGTVGVLMLLLGGILGGIRFARWSETLALADGDSHESSRPSLCILCLCTSRVIPDSLWRCCFGAVWLWFRIHGVHALSDLFCRRGVQDGPLCHLYRIDGLRHDVAGHVFRLPAGVDGLSSILCLGVFLHCTGFLAHGIAEDPGWIRTQRRIRKRKPADSRLSFLLSFFEKSYINRPFSDPSRERLSPRSEPKSPVGAV